MFEAENQHGYSRSQAHQNQSFEGCKDLGMEFTQHCGCVCEMGSLAFARIYRVRRFERHPQNLSKAIVTAADSLQVGYLSTLQIGLTKKLEPQRQQYATLEAWQGLGSPRCHGSNFSGQRSHRPRIANSKSTHASVSVGLDKQEWNQMPVPSRVATNNQLAIVANRFNYSFNLKGASWA